MREVLMVYSGFTTSTGQELDYSGKDTGWSR